MTTPLDRPVRIANVSGFYGDRLSAMREQLEGEPIDYLTGDYLAELTMLILGKDRLKDVNLGYAKTFLTQLKECLSPAVDQGMKIVSNAGGLNPGGLAQAIRDLATEQGLDINVAMVDGDDLIARAGSLGVEGAVTANAYLGAFGIAEALRLGADVVITGRVTDAAVVMGPAIAAHGWQRTDFDKLAGALIAGHIIECGAQATGGNFAGFTTIADLTHPGFPVAEVAADGSCVITKQPGTDGAVTVDTVTAQLVYEVGGPTYLNPDVAAHLDSIKLSQQGPDRVLVSGVVGSPPPPTTKVGINRLGGFRNAMDFVLTGLDIDAKATLVRAQMGRLLAADPPAEIVWDLVRTDREDPATQAEATALLRCHVKAPQDKPVGRAFSNAAISLALASYPGFTMTSLPGPARIFGVFTSVYLSQDQVPHRVSIGEQVIEIAAPSVTAEPAVAQSASEIPAMEPAANTARTALGRIAYARSGDKGGDANIGVWIPADHPNADAAFSWLQALLTPERVRELLPEAAPLEIDVYHLPNLRAINLIVHGLLGEGVAASTRPDPQAKAVAEWLRARFVEIPEELL